MVTVGAAIAATVTTLLTELTVPAASVTVSVTVCDRATANRCVTTCPVPNVPASKFQPYVHALAHGVVGPSSVVADASNVTS